MATEHDRVSADEAREILARFARGRETGHAADVWGPLDRLEALAHTVIAQDTEVAELRALLKASIPAAMEALVPMAQRAYDAASQGDGEEPEYPRLVLERSLNADSAEPWRAVVLFEKPVESFDVTTIELAARSHAHPLLALTGLRADLHNLTHAAQGETEEPNPNTTEGDREFDHV